MEQKCLAGRPKHKHFISDTDSRTGLSANINFTRKVMCTEANLGNIGVELAAASRRYSVQCTNNSS